MCFDDVLGATVCNNLTFYANQKLSDITAQLGGICELEPQVTTSSMAHSSTTSVVQSETTTGAECRDFETQKKALDDCSRDIKDDFDTFTEEDWMDTAKTEILCR